MASAKADALSRLVIDSHCHLDLDAFKDDVHEVLHQSRIAGVTRFLIPGTTPEGWLRQRELAARFSGIDLAFGLHPYFINKIPHNAFDQLTKLIESAPKNLVALGEIGLDASLDIPAEQQENLFRRQLLLARDNHLPVILHHRKTHHRLIKILKDVRFSCGGVLHAFSGSEQAAKEYLDLGFKLGIGGTVTYERAQKTRTTVASLSLDDIVLETDAPDMPMAGRQGERNSPAYLPEVVFHVSRLFCTTEQQVRERTSRNYLRLFKVDQ